jgi:hypothetical protein
MIDLPRSAYQVMSLAVKTGASPVTPMDRVSQNLQKSNEPLEGM